YVARRGQVFIEREPELVARRRLVAFGHPCARSRSRGHRRRGALGQLAHGTDRVTEQCCVVVLVAWVAHGRIRSIMGQAWPARVGRASIRGGRPRPGWAIMARPRGTPRTSDETPQGSPCKYWSATMTASTRRASGPSPKASEPQATTC